MTDPYRTAVTLGPLYKFRQLGADVGDVGLVVEKDIALRVGDTGFTRALTSDRSDIGPTVNKIEITGTTQPLHQRVHRRCATSQQTTHVIVDASDMWHIVQARLQSLMDRGAIHRLIQTARTELPVIGRLHRQVQHYLLAVAMRLLCDGPTIPAHRQDRVGQRSGELHRDAPGLEAVSEVIDDDRDAYRRGSSDGRGRQCRRQQRHRQHRQSHAAGIGPRILRPLSRLSASLNA